ncbi:MAG: sulfotransferase [Acidobacteria bacterium]|nr:MAG: sulfotransferase [Acidobacteriota bacterium]
MTELYLHVGMPKTGTTFLQRHCFPHLAGMRYAHSANYRRIPLAGGPPGDLVELCDRLIFSHPTFFDPRAAERWRDRLLADAGGKILISRERLFGNMTGGFRDHREITRRLARLFPDARIVVVVRRQDDLLESLYRQSLQAYYYYSVDDFLTFRRGRFASPPARTGEVNLDVGDFDLEAYVDGYLERFGGDRVLVLPYELLRREPRAFLERLYAFLGVEPYVPSSFPEVHRSYSFASCCLALALNRFVRLPGRQLGLRPIPERPFAGLLAERPVGDRRQALLAALDRRLSLRWLLQHVVDRLLPWRGRLIGERKRRLILARHRRSNRRLDRRLDLGLEGYGYY